MGEECFCQALGFENEDYVCKEAGQLLHEWSKLWKERHDQTAGDAAEQLHGSHGWRYSCAASHRGGQGREGHGGSRAAQIAVGERSAQPPGFCC